MPLVSDFNLAIEPTFIRAGLNAKSSVETTL